MSEQIERRVFNALTDLEGAAILTLCRVTGLFAVEVVDALDRLVERGWVRKQNELFYPISPNSSVNDH